MRAYISRILVGSISFELITSFRSLIASFLDTAWAMAWFVVCFLERYLINRFWKDLNWQSDFGGI